MNIAVLHEDTAVLIVDKPPGVVVNRAHTVTSETIQDWVERRQHWSHLTNVSDVTNNDFVLRSGIVHRIDKETSGCLVIAKTPESFIELQSQFKSRDIEKTYLAIVHGALSPREGEIRAPVGRLPWNREHFGIVPGGKEALTRFETLGTWKNGTTGESLSLVSVYPKTGRTHQIRVHMKYINHPLLGDYLYAGRKTSRDDRQWAGRVMLHAWKLALTHPTTKQRLTVEAPVPRDMMEILQTGQAKTQVSLE